jgi:hypothetical protein
VCVEEKEKIKIEKPDFAHVVIDGPKVKKIKDNDKGKNKANIVFGVNKANTFDTKYTPKCHHCKKVDT